VTLWLTGPNRPSGHNRRTCQDVDAVSRNQFRVFDRIGNEAALHDGGPRTQFGNFPRWRGLPSMPKKKAPAMAR